MDVKTLCLGTLTFGDATGYEIKGYFEDGPFGHFFQAGYGSIYPALGKALREGLVTCQSESQEGRPDKKIYALTPSGQEYLKKELTGMPADDKIRSEFLVSLFFAGYLSPQHLEEVYDHYLADYECNTEKIMALTGDDVPPGQAFVRKFGLHFYQTIGTFLRENRESFLASVNTCYAKNTVVPDPDEIQQGGGI